MILLSTSCSVRRGMLIDSFAGAGGSSCIFSSSGGKKVFNSSMTCSRLSAVTVPSFLIKGGVLSKYESLFGSMYLAASIYLYCRIGSRASALSFNFELRHDTFSLFLLLGFPNRAPALPVFAMLSRDSLPSCIRSANALGLPSTIF